MKRIIFNIAPLILLLITSCDEKPDCFKGTGPLTSEERSTATIRHIELLCNADVIIHPDTINRIKVTAGANLIGKIETQIKDDMVWIRNNNHCNWVRSFDPYIKVEIWTDDLLTIRTDESDGDITFSDTLRAYEFRFDSFSSLGTYHILLDSYIATLALHNGPADFYGAGKIAVAYYYSSGYGIMDFRNIVADKIFMNNRGTNDMFVNADSLIEARIEDSGDIFYRGNPVVQKVITGSGQILPLQ
jgi:hypothetical protein